MTAPRRLQLRRGNTAATSTYVGAPGELVVNTTTNTLFLHDGSTVGGFATTSNITAINNQISSVNANITAANLGMKGYVDSVASQSIYGNSNVKSYLTGGFDGNIIPSANITYSLGSPTRQWRDLFVSNNTIYVGGVPLTIDATGNLTINGNTIPTVAYVNTAVANVNVDLSSYALNANVTAANLGLKGYVDQANTIQSSQLTSANLGIIGYVDNAVSTANIGVKGYVDSQSFYSNAKVATYLPTYSGNIAANISKAGYTWTFDNTGTLTVPANGIITAPIAQEFQLQAKDANSVLRNEINLDPNNGTYMSVWSEELETSFSTSDWATGSWVNEGGGVSAAYFTNAENLQDFWTTGIGSFVDNIEVSINGGARLPVGYDGNNGETYGVLLLLTGVPASSPTTITSLTFYYRTQNRINIDYANGRMLLDAQSMDIYVETTDNLEIRAGENLNLRGMGQYPVRIYTDTETHMWEFDSAGSLKLPSEGKIYGVGAGTASDRTGYISWAGNTSGDGSGLNTMRLVPDQQGLEDLDQYIILDPTFNESGIRIRAGGTQGNSLANLYLGGANSHVKIGAGLNPPVTVMSNNNAWTFGTNGNLTLPNGGTIDEVTGIKLTPAGGANAGQALVIYPTAGAPEGDHIHLAAYGANTELYLGTDDHYVKLANTGGVVINSNDGIGNTAQWTFGKTGTTRFPNSLILAPAGQSITMQSDNYSQLMWENANLTVAPNMAINSNFYVTQNNATLDIGYRDGSSTQIIKSWYWNADGTLTLPASSGQIGRDGYSNGIDLYNNNGGTGYVRMNYADQSVIWGDAGGAHVQSAGTYTWDFDTTGNLKLPSGGYILNSDDSIYGGGNYSNVQVATYLPTYTGVVTASNVAVAGNVTAQYLFGNGSQLTGIIAGSSYSNVQVATYLPTYSGVVTASNVAVAGNVTAIRFFGDGGTLSNVTFNVAGNVTGTSANVTLQAGAYTSVFDNQGNVTVPRLFTAGNIQTAGYLFGNGALLTGIVAGSSYSNVQVETYLPTYAGTVSASLVNSSGNVLSTGLSVFGNTRIGLAGAVSGQFHSVVGNITQTSSGGAVYINTTGNVLAAAVVAGAVTSTGTVAVNAATGITTNQATFLLANATATTINMGGAATTINLGSTASATGNVFVGGQIGSNAYNLTLRANGRYNTATSIDSNGGFNSPPYANQLVIGGTGTGMTANYSAVGGYLTTLTIYNSGTGYRNGDVISVPGGIAGNSFVLQNYSSGRVGAFTGTALYTFGIDGNLIVPGNVSATTFVGSGALLTSLPGYAYGNVNVAAYLNATGYNLYSNVNVANYLTTATITTTGNITAGNLITGGALYVANITTTGASGNISGANYITANVILTNGGWGNISQVANIQANAILVSGNVTATYFVGSGSLLSGVAIKTTGSWTVPTGNSTQSFTVPTSGTYQLWVDCNIPNGILAYNATATVTNSNVPVVGQQFAWVYNGGGTPIDFTSIPNQFVGTGNTIVRSSVSPSVTTNRFDFGINNTSGGNVTVSYGYVKIS
jgi:hypothetical protein